MAICLDLLIGDPRWFPHPVRIIGKWAKWLSRELRPRIIDQKIAGIVMAAIVVISTVLAALVAITLAAQLGEVVGALVRIFLIYTAISMKDMVREARLVQKELLTGSLTAARRQVARIVGRDTLYLDSTGVAAAAVESVAESTVDGIISPLFYAFIGGAPLALAFKAISTLDSMFGYRTQPLREFGWASARLDDAANFIPARMSVIAIPFGALICGRRWVRSFVVALRDRRKHDSPNAAIPEAAFAGALGVSLGGPSSYGGEVVNRPRLGDPLREIRVEDISVACAVSLVSGLVFAALSCGLVMGLSG